MVTEYLQERSRQQPENPFAALIPDQEIAIIPSFTLESGVTLQNVPLAYTTRGKLSPNREFCSLLYYIKNGKIKIHERTLYSIDGVDKVSKQRTLVIEKPLKFVHLRKNSDYNALYNDSNELRITTHKSNT